MNTARLTTLLMKLAWRNLWRKRRRTTLLLLLVAYVSATVIVYWGIIDGYQKSVIEVHAQYLLAPIQVANTTYFSDPDPQNGLESLAFTSKLSALKHLQALSPRLDFPAFLRSAYSSVGVQVRGVSPDTEAKVSSLPNKIRFGQWLKAPGEIILGHSLAQQLDARLGERLVLDTASLNSTQALGFKLIGLIDAGIVSLDQNAVLIHIEDARRLTGLKTATSLALKIGRQQEALTRQAVQASLPAGLQARGVWALLGPIKSDIISARLSVIPIGLLLAVFASIGMTSTMMVTLIERRHEFGLIEALGCPPRRLVGMVFAEALLVMLLGWMLGLCLGYLVIAVLAHNNILGPIFAVSAEVWASAGLAEEFYAAIHPVYSLYAFSLVLLGVALSSLVSLLYLGKLHLSESLRA